MQDNKSSPVSETSVTAEKDFTTFISSHHLGQSIREAVKRGDVAEVSAEELMASERPARRPGPR